MVPRDERKELYEWSIDRKTLYCWENHRMHKQNGTVVLELFHLSPYEWMFFPKLVVDFRIVISTNPWMLWRSHSTIHAYRSSSTDLTTPSAWIIFSGLRIVFIALFWFYWSERKLIWSIWYFRMTGVIWKLSPKMKSLLFILNQHMKKYCQFERYLARRKRPWQIVWQPPPVMTCKATCSAPVMVMKLTIQGPVIYNEKVEVDYRSMGFYSLTLKWIETSSDYLSSD